MRNFGYRPGNHYLVRAMDSGWRRWLTAMLAGAVAVALMLTAFAGPRQTAIRLRYDLAQLQQEVTRLEREHRQLELERERLSSPGTLARDLPVLNLETAPPERIAFLTPDGRLAWLPGPTPAPAVPGRGAPR